MLGPKVLVKTCLQHSQLCLSPPSCLFQLVPGAKRGGWPQGHHCCSLPAPGPTHRHPAHLGSSIWAALPLPLTTARSQNCSGHRNPVKGSRDKEGNKIAKSLINPPKESPSQNRFSFSLFKEGWEVLKYLA